MFWNLRYKCKWAEFSFDLAVVCIFFEVAQKEKVRNACQLTFCWKHSLPWVFSQAYLMIIKRENMFFEGVTFPGSNVSSAVQCAVVPGPPKIWTKHSNGPIRSRGVDSKTPTPTETQYFLEKVDLIWYFSYIENLVNSSYTFSELYSKQPNYVI